MQLVAILVGKPRRLGAPDAADRFGLPWTTGYGKARVQEVVARTLNLEGDGQADRRHHGGPDMAVLAYAADHYPSWRAELDWPAMGPGTFGENLCVTGASEDSVCIGDVWDVGDARLQVSEPRKPCDNISRFWRREGLLARVVETGRIGWYLRVLREGRIAEGQGVTPVERPHGDWTVSRAMRARLGKARALDEALALARLPALGVDWREKLLARSSAP